MTSKKQQVIDKAVLLFSKYGYSKICVDRICKESDVSKMTVYKYFPTKELIFEAALEERNNKFINDLDKAISKKEGPINKLKSIFSFYHQWFNHKDFSGCLFINSLSFFSGTNDKVVDIARKNKKMVEKILNDIIGSLISSEETKNITPHIIKLLDGAIISAQVGIEENPANSAWLASAALLSAKGADIEIIDLRM